MLSEIETAVMSVVRSGRYLHGPATKSFEESLSRQCGAKHVVGVSNGLDALRLIFRAYIENGKLKEGDEIIYPANTYIASILPLSEFGLTGVGVEPSEIDYNIDFQALKRTVTSKTKGVLLVHLYGNPCWDLPTARFLKENDILIIEDNAQAIGACAQSEGFNGRKETGGLGDAAAFSFYPTKNIGALGDAGAVATSDSSLAETIRALANYGSDRRYHNIYKGYNCRIDEIQAAALDVKLRHIDEITHRRQSIAETYNNEITNPLIIKPALLTDRRQVWHQYVIRTKNRDALRKFLADKGIETDIHYATPPHLQPCYLSEHKQHFPLTEQLANEIISLPIAGISKENVSQIANIINQYEQ